MASQNSDAFYYVYSGTIDRFLFGSRDYKMVQQLSSIMSSKISCMVINEDWIDPAYHVGLRTCPLLYGAGDDSKDKFHITQQLIGQQFPSNIEVITAKKYDKPLEAYGDFLLQELYDYVELVSIVLREIVEAQKQVEYIDLPMVKTMETLSELYTYDEFYTKAEDERKDNWADYFQDVEEIYVTIKRILYLSDSVDEVKKQFTVLFEIPKRKITNNFLITIIGQYVTNNISHL